MKGYNGPNISEAFFPVEQRPVFFQGSGSTTSLFGIDADLKQIRRMRAVVDAERDYVFAVVGENYRLITNREAVTFGKRCFRRVFGEDTADEMDLLSLEMPTTRSFCHADFTHRGRRERADSNGRAWLPFLRVTNSYNRTRKLRFDLGFCRVICSNGMILRGKQITFGFSHSARELGKTIEFRTMFREFTEVELEFKGQLDSLKAFPVPRERMLPLLCRALRLSVAEKKPETPQEETRRDEFLHHVDSLSQRYTEELGQTAYAAFNLMTDFASRPVGFISQATVIDSLQRRSGEWLMGFAPEVQAGGVHLDDYLADVTARLAQAGLGQ